MAGFNNVKWKECDGCGQEFDEADLYPHGKQFICENCEREDELQYQDEQEQQWQWEQEQEPEY